MVCYISCALAFGLIGASVFTTLSTHKKVLISDFMTTLNDEQRQTYEEISIYRLRLFLSGLAAGLILGFIYLYLSRNLKKITDLQTMCTFLLIVLGTQYFFYILAPKKKVMADVMTSQESIKEWYKINSYMSKMYHLGFLFGFIGYCILAYGVTYGAKKK